MNLLVLKHFAIILLFSLLILGCSSSKKESNNAQKQQNTDSITEQSSTPQDSILTTRLFSTDSDTSGLATFSGQMNYTGNEPFTSPALFVAGGVATYKLKADDTFLEETFENLSGKTVTIYGKVVESENESVLEVHFYELKDN